MDTEHLELWERVREFPLEEPFRAKLRRENGWSSELANRAIEEYRRFAFLSVAAGHPVSPSDTVDQVWHLHLTYTKNYWNSFCREVLGRPLHHTPSSGDSAENEKFDGWYANTLASYERFFGPPPAEFWPRGGSHGRYRRVDVADHWVIRKPHFRRENLLPLGAFAAVFLAGCTGRELGPNPFDWYGPDFLALFFLAQLAAYMAAWWMRMNLRGGPGDANAVRDLNPYEAAYVQGGKRLVENLAVVSLVARGAAKVSDDMKANVQAVKQEPFDFEIEEHAYRSIAHRPTEMKNLRRTLGSDVDSVGREVSSLGLVVRDEQLSLAIGLPAIVALLPILFGVIKMMIGLDRGRPVGFLIGLMIIGGIICLASFLRRPHRTKLGDSVMRKLQSDNEKLKRAFSTRTNPINNVLMGAALFGMTNIAVGDLGYLNKRLSPQNGSSSCGGGCSGGGGGDGGGGGCGGCGGGGD